MDGIMLRFIELMIIMAIYENTDEDGPPTQTQLLGKSGEWNGLINNLMYSIYLLDDEGEANDIGYGSKLKSANTFLRGVKKMRKAGVMIDSDKARTSRTLTTLGMSIGEYMSQFAHYSDMPKAALIKNGKVQYGG
jgi:hypothetical protein